MKDFTRTYSHKSMLAFLFPVILAGVAQQACSLISVSVLSRFRSYESVAVIGSLSAYASFQTYLFVDMTAGFGVYLTRCAGTRDPSKVRRALYGGGMFVLVFGILCALLGLLPEPLMRLAQVPPELQSEGRTYLSLLLLSCAPLGIKNLLFCTAQGLGEARIVSLLSLCGVVLHTALTVCFIAVFGLSAAATPLAAITNNLVQIVVLLLLLRSRGDWSCFSPDFSICSDLFKKNADYRSSFSAPSQAARAELSELVKNGFSKSGMTLLIGIGGFLLQRGVNTLSAACITANAVAGGTLNNFFMQPLTHCATFARVAAGQNTGAGSPKNRTLLQRYMRTAFLWNALFGILCTLICFLFGETMLRAVIGSSITPEILNAGMLWLHIASPAYVLLGMFFICRTTIQVFGKYRLVVLLGLLNLLISLVTAWFGIPSLGYTAVCISVAVKWGGLGLLSYIFYRRAFSAPD